MVSLMLITRKKPHMRAFLPALILLSGGCAIRTMGMHDPASDSVQTLARAQVDIIKALTDALARAQSTACPVPVERDK
jgi:hypothetical protein